MTTTSFQPPKPPAMRGVALIYNMFLDLETHIVLTDIEHVTLEVGSVGEFFNYLRTESAGQKLKDIFSVNPQMSILICGMDNVSSEEKREIGDWLAGPNHASIEFHNVETGFENLESRNVVKVRNAQFFYWYISEVRAREFFGRRGAFLLPVSEEGAKEIIEAIKIGRKTTPPDTKTKQDAGSSNPELSIPENAFPVRKLGMAWGLHLK